MVAKRNWTESVSNRNSGRIWNEFLPEMHKKEDTKMGHKWTKIGMNSKFTLFEPFFFGLGCTVSKNFTILLKGKSAIINCGALAAKKINPLLLFKADFLKKRQASLTYYIMQLLNLATWHEFVFIAHWAIFSLLISWTWKEENFLMSKYLLY